MGDWIVLVLGIVLLVVVVALVVWYFYRKNNPKQAKQTGRGNKAARAVGAAKRFARSNSFRVIAPATIAQNGAFAHLDAVVIGYFGVLGVKALGYNGEIYGGANEAEWLQVNADGSRTRFANPITEAAADVRVIRNALLAAKLRQIPVEVYCVFTDKGAQLALPRGTGHLSMKEFKNLLGKEKYLADTGLDLDKVEAALRAALAAE